MKKRLFAVFLALFIASGPAYAGWGDFLQRFGLGGTAQPSQTKILSGLKEALQIGSEKAVALTACENGYFKNEAIKILLPERLRKAESMLRPLGLGSQLDQLILSMNRAAEAAAPQAKPIFLQAISGMSIQDVMGIYRGGDTAATDYFKNKTFADLAKLYRPVVAKTIAEYQVSRFYQTIAGRYNVLPVAKQLPLPGIEDYVVERSLAGLFYMLGEQEKAIRKDPAARVTQLLKDVFTPKK
ncbi:MAG: DUF4197 domain-containing protein [Candidatus Omnitrophota bacterium]